MFNYVLRFSAAALLMAAVATISSCGDKPETVKFKLGTVKMIDTLPLENDYFSDVLLSTDKKFAYVKIVQGTIFRVDLKDGVKSFHNKANYTKLSLENKNHDDSAGKAKLNFLESDPGNRIIFITNKGVGVLTNLRNDTNNNMGAIAIFEGTDDVPTLAWTSDAAHMAAIAPLRDTTRWNRALRVIKDGDEYIVVQNETGVTGEVSSVKLAAGEKFIGKIVAAAGWRVLPEMVASKDKLFFVGDKGVALMPLSDLGKDKTLDAITSDANSKNWQMDSTFTTKTISYRGVGYPAVIAGRGLALAGTEAAIGTTGIFNNSVSGAVLQGDKILISLMRVDHAMKQFTGGIAVYDITTGKSSAPNKAYWSNFAGNTPVLGMLYNDKAVALIFEKAYVDFTDEGVVDKTILGLQGMLDNKYTKRRAALVKNAEEILYDFSSFPSFSNLVSIENDTVGFGSAQAPFTIHYEDKEIAVKKPAEKQE